MNSILKKIIPAKKNGGFTLVELLVTIVIFVVLTGVVLFSQTGFNNTVLVNDLAYSVALTVRQAQDYGVNVNESQTANIFSSYGVYFNLGGGGSNKNYVFFADTDKSGTYNGSPSAGSVTYCPSNDTECVQSYAISNGNYVSGICAGSDSGHCASTNTLTILFTRPNPDAIITSDGGSAGYADISVSSANGTKKDIIVTGVGQIYVQK